MGADQMAPEIVGSSLRERADRNPRRVGADDRAGASHRVDALQEVAFGIEPLDNRLDGPVCVSDPVEVGVEASGADESGAHPR